MRNRYDDGDEESMPAYFEPSVPREGGKDAKDAQPADNRNDTVDYWRTRATTAELKIQEFAAQLESLKVELGAQPPPTQDGEAELREALRDVLASWEEFYTHLPDGEYHGLGEMRASFRDGRAALARKGSK